MLPSDLNLSMGKTKGYNNKVLVSNTDMKIGSNWDINKDHKKLPVTPPDDDMTKIVVPVVQRDNPKVLTEKHNDEELVIMSSNYVEKRYQAMVRKKRTLASSYTTSKGNTSSALLCDKT